MINSKNKKLVILVVALVVLVVAFFIFYFKDRIVVDKDPLDKVLATVGGREITQRDLNEMIWGIDFQGTIEKPNKVEEEKKIEFLNQLIEWEIIKIKAEDLGIKLTEEEFENLAIKRLGQDRFDSLPNLVKEQKKAIEKTISNMGLTEKVKENIISWSEGEVIIINFSTYLPQPELGLEFDEEREQKYNEQKEYAEQLANQIYNEIKRGDISFNEGADRVLNDPVFGIDAFYPSAVYTSESFIKEQWMERRGVVSNQQIRDKIVASQKGVNEPVLLKSGDMDYGLLIANIIETNSGFIDSYGDWLNDSINSLVKIIDPLYKDKITSTFLFNTALAVSEATSCRSAENHWGGPTADVCSYGGAIIRTYTRNLNGTDSLVNVHIRITGSARGQGACEPSQGAIRLTKKDSMDQEAYIAITFSTGSTWYYDWNEGCRNTGHLILGHGRVYRNNHVHERSYGNRYVLDCGSNPFKIEIRTNPSGAPESSGSWYLRRASGSISQLSNNEISNINIINDGNMEYDFVWKPNSYTVDMDANGGTCDFSSEIVLYGRMSSPGGCFRDEHQLERYTITSGRSNCENFNSTTGVCGAVKGNVNIQANWRINSYTLNVESNIDNVLISSTTGHDGNTSNTNYNKSIIIGSSINLKAPDRIDDYIFSGWSGCTTSMGQSILITMPSRNITCIANYIEGDYGNLNVNSTPITGVKISTSIIGDSTTNYTRKIFGGIPKVNYIAPESHYDSDIGQCSFNKWLGCDKVGVGGRWCFSEVNQGKTKTITAEYNCPSYILEVRKTGSGSGIVSSTNIHKNFWNSKILGDLNYDGKITTEDEDLILRHTTRLEVIDDKERADINFDGFININDSILISRAINMIHCGGTCEKEYTKNSQETLIASPDSNSIFTGWSGACTGTGTCNITMDSDKTVTANFEKKYNILNVKSSPISGITIRSTKYDDYNTPGSLIIGEKIEDTLLPLHIDGYKFDGWQGCKPVFSIFCGITVDNFQEKTVRALYIEVEKEDNGNGNGTTSDPILVVEKNIPEAGNVKSNPLSIDCGSTCSRSFSKNQEVLLNVTIHDGYKLDSWTSNCSSLSATSCEVTMDTSETVMFNFRDDNGDDNGNGNGNGIRPPDWKEVTPFGKIYNFFASAFRF